MSIHPPGYGNKRTCRGQTTTIGSHTNTVRTRGRGWPNIGDPSDPGASTEAHRGCLADQCAFQNGCTYDGQMDGPGVTTDGGDGDYVVHDRRMSGEFGPKDVGEDNDDQDDGEVEDGWYDILPITFVGECLSITDTRGTSLGVRPSAIDVVSLSTGAANGGNTSLVLACAGVTRTLVFNHRKTAYRIYSIILDHMGKLCGEEVAQYRKAIHRIDREGGPNDGDTCSTDCDPVTTDVT